MKLLLILLFTLTLFDVTQAQTERHVIRFDFESHTFLTERILMQTITVVSVPENGARLDETIQNNSYYMNDGASVTQAIMVLIGADANEAASNIAASLVKSGYDASASGNVVTILGDVSFESHTDALVIG